ncbi:MAG TPA: DMT family transporter [Actinomycetota bacterium]
MSARRGFAGFGVCTLSWGSLGVLVRQIDLDAPTIVFFRLAFGLAVVLAWVLARGRAAELRPGGDAPLLVASGIVLGAHWALEFEAFQRLDVAAAILIVFVGPVLMAAAAPRVLGERLRARTVVALVAAFAGIVLIALPRIERVDAPGLLTAGGSAVLFAVLMLMGKVLTRRHSAPAIVTWQLGVATALAWPFLLGADGGEIARALPLLVLLGVVFTGVLGVLFFEAVSVLEAQQFGVLFYLEPASAVLYAWVFLGERPLATTLAGGAMIVAAGLAIIVADRGAARGSAPAMRSLA